MSCKDCPEGSIPEGVTLFIAYLGGPPESPFVSIRAAIIDDGIVRRFQPTVQDTGAIEYSRDTPVPNIPEGYQPDPTDAYILYPIWPSCAQRAHCVNRLDDGQLDIISHCFSFQPGSKNSTDILLLSDCVACKIRTQIK
jgi:hypothetical protein